MKRLTMSKTQLVGHCLHFLRDDVEWARDESSIAGIEGTFVHAMIEAHGNDTDCPATPEGIDEAKCVRMYECWAAWQHVHGQDIRHEVALAYNPETGEGRELVRAHHRDYSDVRPGEIAGTLDGVSFDEPTRMLEVYDWKTGKPVADAARNMQLAAGLLAARALYPHAERFRVHLVYLNDEGRPAYVDSALLHEMDLDAARAELRAAFRDHATALPTPGAHCTGLYCPARGTCSATVQAMVELSEVSTQSIETIVSKSIKSPEDVRRVWPLLIRAEELLKAARSKVANIVEHQPVVLPSGNVLRMTEPTKRETFAKSRIPEAKRDEVLAELRAMGALTESTSKGYLAEKRK